ncbi:helix-turn-helix domain-containing protein [Rhizomicrobium electricum]|nr:AcrR family transcriptional regulator [Rhizomicrobium electricum]
MKGGGAMTTIGHTWRRRKRERPEEILTAARIEFHAHPAGAVTMKQIADRAGVAKGTIYLYYASKAELITAAIASVRNNQALPVEQISV